LVDHQLGDLLRFGCAEVSGLENGPQDALRRDWILAHNSALATCMQQKYSDHGRLRGAEASQQDAAIHWGIVNLSAHKLEPNSRVPVRPIPATKQALWWICLLVAPTVLIVIELFHPANFTKHPGMYQFLSRPEHDQPQFQAVAYFGPSWWFTLHMIQTPMIGLVAVGLWLMVEMRRS
jgi:hypothetical protein